MVEGHGRRGIGSLICRALTKKIGEIGEDVSAAVFAGNEAALRMFRRIGFQVVDTYHFMELRGGEMCV